MTEVIILAIILNISVPSFLAGDPLLRRFSFLLLSIATVLACPHAKADESPLTTVSQIRHLTPEQVGKGMPVLIRGVVTFYEPFEPILFVQDQTGPIYVGTTGILPIHRGDLVEIRGVTEGSYSADITSTDIRVIGTAPMPTPRVSTFPELISGSLDCEYVTVTGAIRSVTLQQTIGNPFLLLEVLMDGGYIDVHVEHPEDLNLGANLESLLDTQVSLTGVTGGAFDGKYQLVGSILYLDSPRDISITTAQSIDPRLLPLTPMDRVMAKYNILERSSRVRVRGSVTLYEPGTQLVIESGQSAIRVATHERTPLKLGEVVDATGFPNADSYVQSLVHGQFLPTSHSEIIHPQLVRSQDALSGKYAFNLISIEGRLIEQVHEAWQDTLVVDADGHAFSAVFRHPSWSGGERLPDMPKFSIGSRIRVTGVCFVESGGPWNGALWFELHMRTPDDVSILELPSWWTVRHLLYIIGGLWVVIVIALIWAAVLRRRVHLQTRVLRNTMEEESIRQRRQAFLEKERSRVLEAINSSLPLDEVLGMITDFISEQLNGLRCWCELNGHPIVGSLSTSHTVPSAPGSRQSRREIFSSAGTRLGAIILDWGEPGSEKPIEAARGAEVLDIGASLAALAIDNRRLYEGLLHRSQYDQLTEVPNRFLLKTRIGEALEGASRSGQQFALIYIDLDRFKTVNDRFGHRVGDIYLQQVARRLSERLRNRDTLARVGGDEFIALIAEVRDRKEAEEIAQRLVHCFDLPFHIDDQAVYGSASIGISVYPEDGEDEDQLKRIADSDMYATKQRQAS